MTDSPPPIASDAKSLSQLLRIQTREAHERVEAAVDHFGAGWTLSDYGRLLARWRAFHQFWEPAALNVAPREIWSFVQSRGRLSLLEQDLNDLALHPAAPPFDRALLPVNSTADLLGGLYVIEGSTLGGQVLCKRFAAALPLRIDHGLRYFHGYGALTAARWNQTKQLLEDPRWRNDQAAIIAAANRTFAALTEHFAAG